MRDLGEVGPEDVVEDAGAERVHDRVDAADRDRGAGLAEAQRLREVDEARDVVEVGVGDEGLLDRELLRDGQRAADRASVEKRVVVDEERGGAMPEPFAPEGAEHPDPHNTGY